MQTVNTETFQKNTKKHQNEYSLSLSSSRVPTACGRTVHSFSSTVWLSLSGRYGTAPGRLCFLRLASFLFLLSLIVRSSCCAFLTCLGTCLCRAMRATWGWLLYFSFSLSLYCSATRSRSRMMPSFSAARPFHTRRHISSLPLIINLLSNDHATVVSLCILLV